MATLTLEERPLDAELTISLNGLPLAPQVTLRTGDCIRAGDTILRFDESPTFEGARSYDFDPASVAAEPKLAYDLAVPGVAAAGHQCLESNDDARARDLRSELIRDPHLVAEAPCMRRLLDRVRRVACRDASVLLLGESGSGKDVLARAIHANGPRARKRFVPINAAALPGTMIESELFGYERGAFTGAAHRRAGLFETAHGGTLFLDEVGELPLSSQAKLLRVLETGEIRRLGGSDVVETDVRVIAATNRDLRADMRDGKFRSDLYFRLAVVELEIPPLRERRDDIRPLAERLLASIADRGHRPLHLSDEALACLLRHPFQGNVRELRNILEHAASFCDGEVIRCEDLPPQVAGLKEERSDTRGIAFEPLVALERRHVAAALALAGGNKTRAAALLGIDRKTLYAKIAAHGITPCGTTAPAGSSSSDSVDEHPSTDGPRSTPITL